MATSIVVPNIANASADPVACAQALITVATQAAADVTALQEGGGAVNTSVLHHARNATATGLAASAYANGVRTASGNGALGAIDGVTNIVGDRILDKNAGSALCGLWVITDLGGAGPWKMTRATDFDDTMEVRPGTLIAVSEGTANTKTFWAVTNAAPVTVGSSTLTFDRLILPATSTLPGTMSAADFAKLAEVGTASVTSATAAGASNYGAVKLTDAPASATAPIAVGANSAKLPPAPTAAGKTIYDTGTAYSALAAGTEGQILTAHGAGAPTWETTSVGTVIHRTVTLAFGDLGALGGGVKTFSKALAGGALPANARYIGHVIGEGAFTGFQDVADTGAYAIELGVAGTADVMTSLSVRNGATGFPKTGTAGTLGFPMAKHVGTPTVLLTGAPDLKDTTAGSVVIDFYYLVLA